MTDEIKVNGVRIDPRFVPFQCPVCNGFGSLRHGTKECQGCDGKGWVAVDQRPESYAQELSTFPQSDESPVSIDA